jgi:hypothetical protein
MVGTTDIDEHSYIDSTYRTIASQQRPTQFKPCPSVEWELSGLRLNIPRCSVRFSASPRRGRHVSNVLVNKPKLMGAMFNNDPKLFNQNTAASFATLNAADLRGLAIHVVIGSEDALSFQSGPASKVDRG